MATPLRRIKQSFAFRPDCQQNWAISQLLYPFYGILSCDMFCTYHEQNSSTSEEKQHDCNISDLDSDKLQPSTNQKSLPSDPRKLLKKRNNSKHKSHEKPNQAANVKRCGKIMTSMLHKTYWNMKDRQLINNTDSFLSANSPLPHASLETTDLIILEKTFYPSRKREPDDSKTSHVFFSSNREVEENSDSLNGKELFFKRMHQKYQDPDDNEATALAQCYPNPVQIFEEVVHPLLEAKGLPVPEPEVTSHLRQVYWKASLAVPWTQCLIATHSHKETAVNNVYLKACEQLKKLGLMRREKDTWEPMTSERVVSMLETLAKYIESSFVASKGRGFKIILNQAKDCSSQSNHQSNGDTRNERECQFNTQSLQCLEHLQSCNDFTDKPESYKKDKTASYIGRVGNQSRKYKDRNCVLNNVAISSKVCKSSTSSACGNAQLLPEVRVPVQSSSMDPAVTLTGVGNAKWECIVHVGWPFPFTVQAQGISLPGVQMLGYMEVATKLKTQGLLTSCNSALSPQVLGRLMLLDLQAHWEKSLHSYLTDTLKQKFAADAELFCDASISGFGAYLVLQETGKVSWLCESWRDHDRSFLDIVYPRRWMFESTLAEFYAIVTAVYSWKKKLRGKRLLCFTDSQTTVGLINSFMANRVKNEYCLHTLDQLVESLQGTCLSYSITLQAVWVDRERNILADLLSRKNTTKFCDTVPRAALHKTKAKKLSIAWSQYA